MSTAKSKAPVPKSKGAGASRSKAARTERNGGRTAKFRGTTLTLPPELPLSFAFDLVEIEAADAAGSGDAFPILRLLRSLLGAEQFNKVRNLIDGADEDEVELFKQLVDVVFESYGVTAGEA